MKDHEQPPTESARFEAGTLHVLKLPDENLATLTRVEFRVLRDGEVSEAKSGRDLCFGFLISALIGLAGLAATVDWATALRTSNIAPFYWIATLIFVAAGSACGTLIYHLRYHRTRKNSAYADLMDRLGSHFGSG